MDQYGLGYAAIPGVCHRRAGPFPNDEPHQVSIRLHLNIGDDEKDVQVVQTLEDIAREVARFLDVFGEHPEVRALE